MDRNSLITATVAFLAVVAVSLPGMALSPPVAGSSVAAAPSVAESMRMAGWSGVKVLAEAHGFAVAIGKDGKKAKPELIVGRSGEAPSSLGLKPAGTVTAAIRPFHSFGGLYRVDATTKSRKGGGEHTETTIHLVRLGGSGPQKVCSLPGGSSRTAAPPKCGSRGTESVGIVPVDGTDVPTFDVTKSYSGVVTRLGKSGSCEPKGKPSHPAPKAIRWELPYSAMCRSIGAGVVTRP